MTTQSSTAPLSTSEVTTSYAAALASSNAAASKSQMSKNNQNSPIPQAPMPTANGVSAGSTRSSTPHLVPNGIETNAKSDGSFSVTEVSRQSSPSARDDDASTTVTYPDDKSDKGSFSSQQEIARSSSFVPAAPPSVNPWKKRQEDQATKSVSVQSSASSSTSDVAKPIAATTKSGKKGTTNGNIEEKKDNDGMPKETKKATEEGSTKPSKSSKRAPVTETQPAEPSPPPSVIDMVSWPTPDLAQGEFKKEKEESAKEKDKAAPSSGRSVNKWVPVVIDTPYVPPIPTKSGRGRGRGGREGGGRGGGQGGDRSERSNANGVNGEGDRGRQYNGSNTRGNYQGTRGAKRSSSAGGNAPRRESKAGANSGPTDRKREPREGNEWKESVENSATSQTERSRRGSKDPTKVGEGDVYGSEPRQYSESQERYQNYSKSDRNSQWSYGAGRGESESTYPPRERGSERGRSGYRRGNYHGQYTNGNHNSNYQGQNGTAPFPSNANGHSYSSNPHPRGGSFRSRGGQQSFGNSAYRFNPAMQPPPFAQPFPPYDYNMVSPTAPPVEIGFLVQQINYYFSVENLCKDIYLRKHMDTDGYVRLSFLIGFNRVQMHTKELSVLRDACLQSQEVQLMCGTDDYYIRKRDGWENWVLKEEERDPTARRDQNSWYIDPRQRMAPSSTTPPGEMSGSAEPFFPGAGPMNPAFFPQQLDTMYTNGFQPLQSGLSAAVPEFSPSTSQENGILSNAAVPPVAADELPDTEVDSLIVVVKRPIGDSAPASPESSPTKRPNGAKDIGTITERLQSVVVTNGDTGNEERTSVNTSHRSHRSQTDIGWFSSSTAGYTMDPNMTHRSYTEVRAQALKLREELVFAKNNDLITLYKFWSHFLVKSYKGSMYKEFRQYALEDADQKVRFGVDELLKMYERSFQHRHTIGFDVIKDFVNLVRVEARHGEPLGIEKLRNILSNPSLKDDYKRTIEGLIDAELRNILTYGVGKKNDRSPAAEPYKASIAI